MKMPRMPVSHGYLGKNNPSRGFTLLEVLIAMVIFAVVATTIFGSFNFIFSTTDAFDGGMAVHESARACLSG
jgi:prepilin-type N-terminal cleavage/methylation domain-containing protein